MEMSRRSVALLVGCGTFLAMLSILPGTSRAEEKSITAGDGLIASPSNPIVKNGTLSVNFGGSGSASSAARSDHDHDGRYSSYKLHLSAIRGPISVPTDAFEFVVKSITFTPTHPDDLVLAVRTEGSYTRAEGEAGASMQLVVRDSTGKLVLRQVGPSNLPAGANVAFYAHATFTLDGPAGTAGFKKFLPPFTIQLLMFTSSAWVGQVDTIQFKVLALENAIVVSPSPDIAE